MASAVDEAPSYIEQLANSISVSSTMNDWNSNKDCNVPWLISGWYGVYAVTKPGRDARCGTTAGMKCMYAPAPRREAFLGPEFRDIMVSQYSTI